MLDSMQMVADAKHQISSLTTEADTSWNGVKMNYSAHHRQLSVLSS